MNYGMLPMLGGQSGGGMFGGGPMMGMGPGMFGQDDEEEKKKRNGGMSPLMMISPLAGMFMSGHPNIGLGMISPLAGGMRALGMFK